ncbi:MFS_1 domain-containing protein [Rhizoctonia solani AG-1 IA]|uniref:MFS_1 domain-containing protein n=1 Tax=Thanatephorus cucumeris (strain AG1-IA) TaxID=983506 RepID=L8WSM3_THACA|nr:MFS_1 domain-containing protein [Rhizoctonia solani AG-1 IA]
MDSKVTLEGSVPITPTVSLDHDPRRESVEMTVFNRSHTEADQINSPKDTIVSTHLDDTAAHRKEMIAMAAVCWTQFMAGWNDGTLGPLIPTIQEHFHATIAVIYFTDRFGFGRVLIGGSLFQIVAYSILSTTPPFPAMCVALTINGIGMSLQNAQTSSLVISLTRNPGTKMGMMHAAYGAGACVSPLIATQFSQMPRWSFYFLVSLGLAVSNTVSQSLVFGFRTLPEMLTSFGIPEVVHTADSTQTSKYRQILNIKVIYVLAFFALLYVGTEVTIGGNDLIYNGIGVIAKFEFDCVQWLLRRYACVPKSGAVLLSQFETSGLMLGRLVLLWVNQKVGSRAIEQRLLANIFIGPFYPILMNQSGGFVPACPKASDWGDQLDCKLRDEWIRYLSIYHWCNNRLIAYLKYLAITLKCLRSEPGFRPLDYPNLRTMRTPPNLRWKLLNVGKLKRCVNFVPPAHPECLVRTIFLRSAPATSIGRRTSGLCLNLKAMQLVQGKVRIWPMDCLGRDRSVESALWLLGARATNPLRNSLKLIALVSQYPLTGYY